MAQASFFGFGAVPQLELELHGVPDRKPRRVEMLEGPALMLPVFSGTEKVSGRVKVVLPPGKGLEHLGLKVELKGVIGEWMFTVYYALLGTGAVLR